MEDTQHDPASLAERLLTELERTRLLLIELTRQDYEIEYLREEIRRYKAALHPDN